MAAHRSILGTAPTATATERTADHIGGSVCVSCRHVTDYSACDKASLLYEEMRSPNVGWNRHLSHCVPTPGTTRYRLHWATEGSRVLAGMQSKLS